MNVDCPECGGTGTIDDEEYGVSVPDVCPMCDGLGEVDFEDE